MKSSFVKLRRPRGLDGPRKAIQASLLAGSLLMASLLGSSLIGRAAVVSAAPVVAAGPLLGVNDAEPGAAAATLPFGGVWLPDALGGHFWLAEGTLGFCRLDPAPTAANPDRMLQTNCVADAKLLSPAQATYDPNPIPFAAQIGVPAGAHWL